MGEPGMSSASREAGWEGSLSEEPGGFCPGTDKTPASTSVGRPRCFSGCAGGAVLCLQCHARGWPWPGGTGLGTQSSAAGSGLAPWDGVQALPRALSFLCPGSHPLPSSLPFLSALAVPSLGSATPHSALFLLQPLPPPAQLCFPSWLCAPCPTPCLPHRFVRMLQRTRAALVPQRTLQISWPDAHFCTGPPSPARPLPRTSLTSAVTRSWEPSRAGDAWVPSGGAGGATALALPPQMAWLCKAVLIQAAALVEHEQLHKGRRWRSCSCVQAG